MGKYFTAWEEIVFKEEFMEEKQVFRGIQSIRRTPRWHYV